MVSIKSLIVLTFAAFVAASPMVGKPELPHRLHDDEISNDSGFIQDTPVFSGTEKGSHNGHRDFKEIQNNECGPKGQHISCCTSEEEAKGLLGVAAGANAQCSMLGAAVPFGIGSNILSGNNKDQKCSNGQIQCCSYNKQGNSNTGTVVVSDNSAFDCSPVNILA